MDVALRRSQLDDGQRALSYAACLHKLVQSIECEHRRAMAVSVVSTLWTRLVYSCGECPGSVMCYDKMYKAFDLSRLAESPYSMTIVDFERSFKELFSKLMNLCGCVHRKHMVDVCERRIRHQWVYKCCTCFSEFTVFGDDSCSKGANPGLRSSL